MDATKRFILLILSVAFPSNDIPISRPYDLEASITEEMGDMEFCAEVQTKFILTLKKTPHIFSKRMPSKEFIDSFSDYVVNFPNNLMNRTVCNKVIEDLNQSIFKFSAVVLSGFFSPDFVKSNHPYRVASNSSGNVTNLEFCSSVQKLLNKAASDIVRRRGLNKTLAEMKVLKYSEKIGLVIDDSCDEIINDLNASKRMKSWKDLENLIAIFKLQRSLWDGAVHVSNYWKDWEDADRKPVSRKIMRRG